MSDAIVRSDSLYGIIARFTTVEFNTPSASIQKCRPGQIEVEFFVEEGGDLVSALANITSVLSAAGAIIDQ